MSLLRKLFGKRQSPATGFQGFLETLTPEYAQQTYHSVQNKELRLPSAISSIVLYVVSKFMVGYSEMVRDTSKAAGASIPSIPHDTVAFEVAAYVHYYLMREQLQYDIDDDDEYEDDESDEHPYFVCLRDAVNISDALIKKFTSFSLPEHFFMNRIISYSAHDKASELFLQVLLSSQGRGVPGLINKSESTNLPTDIAAVTYIGIFHKIYLNSLPESIQGLFADDMSGLL